jgi:hypothetical protein
VPRHPKRERLAGARPPHDDADAGAVQARVADHARLVLPKRRVRRQRLADGLGRDQAGAFAGAIDRCGDQALLDGE